MNIAVSTTSPTSTPGQLPVCSICIVNWNVAPLLKACLSSIAKQTVAERIQTIVVDNASTDGSAEMVATTFPQVQLIRNQTNTGFARANNQALAQTTAPFVLFLNPDTELPIEAIKTLIDVANQNPTVGIFGPKLLNPDGSLQPSVRRFPDFLSQAMVVLKLHHRWPKLRPVARYYANDHDSATFGQVDQVMGACFFVRRDVIKAIGGFDEGYWIWFEEVDYCRRAKNAGWPTAYSPTPAVIHHGGTGFRQVASLKRQRLFLRSLNRYFARHHPWPARLGLLFLEPIALVAVFFAQWTKR